MINVLFLQSNSDVIPNRGICLNYFIELMKLKSILPHRSKISRDWR